MTGKMIHSTIIVCLTHRAISLRCIRISCTRRGRVRARCARRRSRRRRCSGYGVGCGGRLVWGLWLVVLLRPRAGGLAGWWATGAPARPS